MAKEAKIISRTTKRTVTGTTREGGNKQITLLLTPRQFMRVDRHAKKNKISFAEAIRTAVDKVY
jgi:hypothetical protein